MVYLSNRNRYQRAMPPVCCVMPTEATVYACPNNPRLNQKRMLHIINVNIPIMPFIHLYRQSCTPILSGKRASFLYAHMCVARYANGLLPPVHVLPCNQLPRIRAKVATLGHCVVGASLPVTALLVDLGSPPLEVLHHAWVDEAKKHDHDTKGQTRIQRRA